MSFRIDREWRELSQDSLLEPNIRDVNTWPYLPKGLLGIDDAPISDSDMGRIQKELEQGFLDVSSFIDKLKERQTLIVTWILAVAIGICGNFLVNLFFGPVNLEIPILSVYLSIIVVATLVILILVVFVYLPITLDYKVHFIPPWKYPSQFFPRLPAEELSPRAHAHAAYQSSFHRKIVEYVNLISLAILRDEIANFEGKRLKVKIVMKLIPNYPFFDITFGFKTKLFFWHPKMVADVRAELNQIISIFLNAKISLGVFGLDENEENWLNRGPSFLNEIVEWNIEHLNDQLENQILESN